MGEIYWELVGGAFTADTQDYDTGMHKKACSRLRE